MADQELPAEEITLIDQDGTEHRFLLHDAFDVEGVEYYLVEAADDADLVLVLKEEGGRLATVDQPEFDRIMAMLENEPD